VVHVFAGNRQVAAGRIQGPGEAAQLAQLAPLLAATAPPPLLPPVFLPPAPPPPPLLPPVVWLPPEVPPERLAPETALIPEAPPDRLLVLALLARAALAGWRRR
jgi:hypothetical protein